MDVFFKKRRGEHSTGFDFFFGFRPKGGPWYNARLRASTVALIFSLAESGAVVGTFANFLIYVNAALTSSAVDGAISPVVVVAGLALFPTFTVSSNELFLDRDLFGIIKGVTTHFNDAILLLTFRIRNVIFFTQCVL